MIRSYIAHIIELLNYLLFTSTASKHDSKTKRLQFQWLFVAERCHMSMLQSGPGVCSDSHITRP